jgi:hypothetical protein
MKSTSLLKALLTLTAALGILGVAATNAVAHDGQWDSRHHYYRDNYGYWDEHDHYHHYLAWHNHHGYWDNRGGTRVFISVD